MADPVNWDDPCARYTALRDSYLDAIRGGRRMVRFQTGGNIQEVQYGDADVTSLRVEMERARSECAVLTGKPLPGRFAIRLGARRASPLLPGPVVTGVPEGEV